MINMILAMSLNLVNGYTGQFSLGHAGFMATGAGWIVGLPSLRLKGDYLAIVTLGFGEIIRVVLLNTPAVGGARGMTGTSGPGDYDNVRRSYLGV